MLELIGCLPTKAYVKHKKVMRSTPLVQQMGLVLCIVLTLSQDGRAV